MRKLILFSLIFAVFLGSASAQDTLPAPKKPQAQEFVMCLDISWKKVKDAATYQVRVTKYGVGRLQYRTGTPYAHLRGWHDWQDLSYPTKHTSGMREALWCGIAPNQMIRVRVRAVDEHGNPGPSSKPRKFFYVGDS